MPSEVGLEEHMNLLESLDSAIKSAEALRLEDMAENLKEEFAEAEAL